MSADNRIESTEADFDVLVVGGGHAGTEAAVAAARIGARVGLGTSALETIGQMSCNPAIGGVAKGTVVREVDALGGIMGRATDLATLQFRMLNRSKGPAVWAPRAQCDRGLYRRAARSLIEEQPRLHTIQGTVARLLMSGGTSRVHGLETLEGRRFSARAIVITAGTFLRGRMHIGTDTRLAGGRGRFRGRGRTARWHGLLLWLPRPLVECCGHAVQSRQTASGTCRYVQWLHVGRRRRQHPAAISRPPAPARAPASREPEAGRRGLPAARRPAARRSARTAPASPRR